MLFVHLALLHAAACIDVRMEGELSFDVKISTGKKGDSSRFRSGHADKPLVFKMMQERENVTAAPEVECVYQYPEHAQVNALLSHMMNELTKVFVHVNEFINEEKSQGDWRRRQRLVPNLFLPPPITSPSPGTVSEQQEPVSEPPHTTYRVEETRFKVVDHKQKQFFELIFANMTNDYKNFYNTTVEKAVGRTSVSRDPCQHQEEIKQIWRDLLKHSHMTLQRAARRCVAEYVRERRVAAAARARLQRHLAAKMGNTRHAQLRLLCDTYQLCFSDLPD